jgi:hypothetical protein
VAVEAQSGKATAIIDEQPETFFDYAHKRYTNYLDESGEILWMSERDGWNHLYLIDAQTGEVKNQITQGPWVVRGVDRVDHQKRQIWFRAGGIHPGQDPYYIHHARVNFDGTGLTLLTEGDGTHTIEYSPEGTFYLDRYSRVDQLPVTELRRTADGRLVCLLEAADHSRLLETGWQPPEPFVAKGRDGETDIYGVIYRPTDFDPQLGGIVGHQVRNVGAVQECLGRNAADVDADAAELVALHYRGCKPQLGRANGADIAGWAAAHHDYVELVGHRSSQ